ncbi:MAG: hypothetical protein HQL98_11355 [Magnetococcales bacterium]|nr:hypothetical protein [Magnetococcales bacterium]
MLRISTIWFLLVLSSPWIVMLGEEKYQVDGWLAIGLYEFDLADGLFRSLYYFVVTVPIIIMLYLGRPKPQKNRKFIFTTRFTIRMYHIAFMILFCLVAFYFNLGITGVETDTGGWRLSGIAHYIRSYIFLLIIAIYVFGKRPPSILIIFIYSTISGITAGSRFVAVAPLMLYLMRLFYGEEGVKRNIHLALSMLMMFALFAAVTTSRLVLLDDHYSFENLFLLISELDMDDVEILYQGFNQLFLRLGLGRDVILSYEVGERDICHYYYGLYFNASSCFNPPMDFYGLSLATDKFYLGNPMLSSVFVVSNEFFVKMGAALLYGLEAFLICFVVNYCLRGIPIGAILVHPLYFLLVVFVLVGPIFFAVYLMYAIIFLSVSYIVVTRFYRALRAGLLTG